MVATMQRRSLDDVLEELVREAGSEFASVPVITRLVLRTGVNLKQPRPDQRYNQEAIGKVVAVLNDMGFLK